MHQLKLALKNFNLKKEQYVGWKIINYTKLVRLSRSTFKIKINLKFIAPGEMHGNVVQFPMRFIVNWSITKKINGMFEKGFTWTSETNSYWFERCATDTGDIRKFSTTCRN